MSRKNNVNPDHYKVAGRERPGHATARPVKGSALLADKTRERWDRSQREKVKRQK